ncbi:MAG: hypothetical protein IJO54_04365 [Oscillospiraceae bacterium]|nr:hypothetical protein [Oscillospiraceae bacterium]
MAQWLKFEEDCTNYLNKKFGDRAVFFHFGGEDSTISDIQVTTNAGRKFYIDAKLTPAQCGQFVLIPNVANRCFVFSDKNKTNLTPQVQAIVKHMNADFEAYKEAGTSGKEIELNDGGKTFCEWIVSTYVQKGAEFIITNNYTILPIRDFAKYFDVTATYRVKRSGSSSVGKGNLPYVTQHIRKAEYPVSKFLAEGSKLFVYSSANLHNKRFVLGEYEYMFSQRGDRFEIRKLSNTFNANVIFSIFNKNQNGLTDTEFITELK